MKKIAIIGIVALVVIGCVLAAGCTSTSTTSTTPATTTSTTTTDAVVGTWTLPNGTTVVFGEDFKGVMTTGDNKINFTWKKNTDGTYQVDNEKGEQVIWTMDSTKNSMTNAAKMVLTKKASSASGASIIGEIVSPEDLSEMSDDEIKARIEAETAGRAAPVKKYTEASQASGTMTDGATTAPQQEVTFTVIGVNTNGTLDNEKNTSAEITADVGSQLYIEKNGYYIPFPKYKFVGYVFDAYICYVSNGESFQKYIRSSCDSKCGLENNPQLFTERSRTNAIASNNLHLKITADMDGKTYYI